MERLADVLERVDLGRLLNGTDGNGPRPHLLRGGDGGRAVSRARAHTGRDRSVYFSMLRAMTIRWIWLVPS